ncbi:hypothetical protein [Pedobacter sp. ASV28]|uniref:hypothetical protein n=1 Tax=Pedobacter sp. ASV28 TaxID=2795123 RepID=UPI0018EA98C4|nr:hypothetical protein [Pedobacter sp. ASV28]
MADWKNREKSDTEIFAPIKRLFENHAIKRMYEINDLHSGKIASALGMNKGRYALKLANPETFLVFELLRFSYIINIDPKLVIDVIQNEKEVIEKIEKRIDKNANKK